MEGYDGVLIVGLVGVRVATVGLIGCVGECGVAWSVG